MKRISALIFVLGVAIFSMASPPPEESGSLAVIYYWKAKEGKLQEYNRYIADVAEPVDAEAKRQGAFVSVTTFVTQRSGSPWTHMRVFILRDRSQVENLSAALDAAATKLESNEAKRKVRAEYAAGLRDFVGREVVDILR